MRDVPLHLCFGVIIVALPNMKIIVLKKNKNGLTDENLSSMDSMFWEVCLSFRGRN